MGRALGLVLLSLCIPATVLLRVVVCQVLFPLLFFFFWGGGPAVVCQMLFFLLFFRVSGAIFISFGGGLCATVLLHVVVCQVLRKGGKDGGMRCYVCVLCVFVCVSGSAGIWCL
jgi:hypothetical protein